MRKCATPNPCCHIDKVVVLGLHVFQDTLDHVAVGLFTVL